MFYTGFLPNHLSSVSLLALHLLKNPLQSENYSSIISK
jgi:hypothetical protein